MSRYNNYKKLNNSSKYYRFLREKRDKSKNLVQYETPILYHPSVLERANLSTTTHIWAVGDRYYNLADQYYGNPSLWWIIAWYNGRPTEADAYPGDVLTIPLDADAILATLGMG
jgi:nucleoid-associated protein YgaU